MMSVSDFTQEQLDALWLRAWQKGADRADAEHAPGTEHDKAHWRYAVAEYRQLTGTPA